MFRLIICSMALMLTLDGATCAEKKTKPVLFLTGADSRIAQRTYLLITDEQVWEKTWLRHRGLTAQEAFEKRQAMIHVDFRTHLIVAVFQGQGINSRALTVEGITETDNQMLVRFDEWTFQTDARSRGVKSSSYGFILLPKTTKTIVLEENGQGLKNGPPKWKRQAVLTGARPKVQPKPEG